MQKYDLLFGTGYTTNGSFNYVTVLNENNRIELVFKPLFSTFSRDEQVKYFEEIILFVLDRIPKNFFEINRDIIISLDSVNQYFDGQSQGTRSVNQAESLDETAEILNEFAEACLTNQNNRSIDVLGFFNVKIQGTRVAEKPRLPAKNTKTFECKKPCGDGTVCNTGSGRCIKKSGKVYKRLRKEEVDGPTPPVDPTPHLSPSPPLSPTPPLSPSPPVKHAPLLEQTPIFILEEYLGDNLTYFTEQLYYDQASAKDSVFWTGFDLSLLRQTIDYVKKNLEGLNQVFTHLWLRKVVQKIFLFESVAPTQNNEQDLLILYFDMLYPDFKKFEQQERLMSQMLLSSEDSLSDEDINNIIFDNAIIAIVKVEPGELNYLHIDEGKVLVGSKDSFDGLAGESSVDLETYVDNDIYPFGCTECSQGKSGASRVIDSAKRNLLLQNFSILKKFPDNTRLRNESLTLFFEQYDLTPDYLALDDMKKSLPGPGRLETRPTGTSGQPPVAVPPRRIIKPTPLPAGYTVPVAPVPATVKTAPKPSGVKGAPKPSGVKGAPKPSGGVVKSPKIPKRTTRLDIFDLQRHKLLTEEELIEYDAQELFRTPGLFFVGANEHPKNVSESQWANRKILKITRQIDERDKSSGDDEIFRIFYDNGMYPYVKSGKVGDGIINNNLTDLLRRMANIELSRTEEGKKNEQLEIMRKKIDEIFEKRTGMIPAETLRGLFETMQEENEEIEREFVAGEELEEEENEEEEEEVDESEKARTNVYELLLSLFGNGANVRLLFASGNEKLQYIKKIQYVKKITDRIPLFTKNALEAKDEIRGVAGVLMARQKDFAKDYKKIIEDFLTSYVYPAIDKIPSTSFKGK